MPFCTRCGSDNADGSRFCSSCGAPLREGAEPAPVDSTSTLTLQGLTPVDPAVPEQAPESAAEGGGLSTADRAAVDALPPGSALLVVRRGPNAGSRFLLDTVTTTAGRHPSSDIFLDDVTVSRRHAEFHRSPDGRFSVRDVGSLNGTYVGRERIDDAVLANGDEVQIGKYRLVFLASAQGSGAGRGTGAETGSGAGAGSAR